VRRILGVVTSAIIALSVLRAVAPAAELGFGLPRPDIASQLMLRLFGETSDSRASFSAQNGDRISESPLRELALVVPAAEPNPSFSEDSKTAPALATERIALSALSDGGSILSRTDETGLLPTDLHFASPDGSSELRGGSSASHPALFTAAYQPPAPIPNISPDPGTMAFDSTLTAPLSDTSKSGSFTLGSDRPSAKHLDLDLLGQYQQLLPNDSAALSASAAPSTTWQPPEGNVSLGVPNYAGSNRLSLGAALAVPVFHGLTLNLNYAAVRSYGGDVLPGLMNLDAANNSYVGGLSYNIPYLSSTLSISAYQNRFGESVLPNTNGVTETGGNVNLTVKF
jgi:hypothetical protein